MTNKEKLESVFPYIYIEGTVLINKQTEQVLATANYNWLSAEYEQEQGKEKEIKDEDNN